MIGEPVDGVPGVRRDGATLALAAALNRTAGPASEPSGTSKDTPMHASAAFDNHNAPDNGPGPQDPKGCPSCVAEIGELHADLCDIAWCAAVGLQRYGQCDTAHGCRTDPRRDCRTAWSGLHPGFAECRELGWYARLTPHGWESCDPGTPGAIEDLNRLMTRCTWDEQQQRYVAPGADPVPPPDSGAPGQER
jgi:hypothetical protein